MSRDTKYIGMDVHKEAIVIAVLNDRGKRWNPYGFSHLFLRQVCHHCQRNGSRDETPPLCIAQTIRQIKQAGRGSFR